MAKSRARKRSKKDLEHKFSLEVENKPKSNHEIIEVGFSQVKYLANLSGFIKYKLKDFKKSLIL